MKIAIIHDELMRKGGAEQVVLSFHTAFPDAPIYTLCYQPEETYPEFKSCDVRTTWFNKLVSSEKMMKMLFFPLGLMAMRSLDLREFDVVLLSTTWAAKFIKLPSNTLMLTYSHTPFRLAWYPDTYDEIRNTSPLKRFLYKRFVSILKRVDKKAALRSDFFITNAQEVVSRIRECYSDTKEITVINPPVKANKFYVSDAEKDYYLIVSRFQPYKKVDLVVAAFSRMPDKKLIVVGKGVMEAELKAMATSNVEFRGSVTGEEIKELYANCKAFMFPQHEDYGITPLEANASGRPVIAYGVGGVLETMIHYQNEQNPFTAVFFKNQTVDDLIQAVEFFETIAHLVDPAFIRKHALQFDDTVFVKKIHNYVIQKAAAHNIA